MFKFLEIENFQSHEKTVLQFDKGVNVIHGYSQAGKTAILRAMNLLIHNRPLGGKRFSDFAGDKGQIKITLGLDNSDPISLVKEIKVDENGEKKVTKTSYKIGTTEFSSPKDQVPDQIVAALNISELNIQNQFDPPFLVSSSGGEIAKTINRITRLEEVDDWVSELTSDINAGNRDITRGEEEAKVLLQKIAVYKDIEETEGIVKELKKIDTTVKFQELKKKELSDLLLDLERNRKDINLLNEFLAAEKYVAKAEKLQKEINEFTDLNDSLYSYKCLTDIWNKEYEALRELLVVNKDLEDARFDEVPFLTLQKLLVNHSCTEQEMEEMSNPLKAEKYIVKAEKMNTDISFYYGLKNILREYEQAVDEEDAKKDSLVMAKNEYLTALKQVGRCPTCFAAIDKKHLKEIAEAL